MVSIWKNKCSVLTHTKQEITEFVTVIHHEPENMFLVGLQFALTHSKPACEDTKTKCWVYILKLAKGKKMFREGGLKGKKLKLVSGVIPSDLFFLTTFSPPLFPIEY